MSKFDHIRPFYDTEVNKAILGIVDDPMMKAIMNFTFPEMEDNEWKKQLSRTHSIRDFQINFIYPAIRMVLKKSSEGLSYSGFDKLDQHTAYLFISNHRDIILDTSLLNYTLYNNGQMMTSSAIGDNLVKKPFLMALSRLTRNFIVQRGLPARELLESSKLMSAYIQELLMHENRSVWIAQREGRTKDGNDATHKGVLKMISMARGEQSEMDYFKQLNIVPVSISYEYDPTDMLKMPELMAKSREEVYVKEKNEDFITLLNGIIGQKKRIHIHVDTALDQEIDLIVKSADSPNKQFQALCDVIDDKIIANYKLWPTNYIAHDLLNNSDQFAVEYSADEKEAFEKRLENGVDTKDDVAVKNFLAMYANPVTNQEALKVKE
ncbi:1-acyl-sn-glycerol-3-phosphate acyltransferase [Echinicola sp. CAU 1574]|uniref:1-acyl-sn-glycerol-3-phosphate acyltransferase n=1 Tax=Echinicola arenosa TaxID=2774144 RepID=A0ABR9AG81_9BACT|nr:1-acyl-sn-glycerol-3-phosphate acyltransferase [Echinicola arenosa]MBD8487660.1 1-acyl-sn-glycerol-3-phosphate acyltransferase [Echinicola arenosa]